MGSQACESDEEMIRDVCIQKDEMLASFAVSSLFISVPVEAAVKVIYRKSQHDKTFEDRTILSSNRRVELLEVCLRSTYFSYGGVFTKKLMMLLWVLMSHLCLSIYT